MFDNKIVLYDLSKGRSISLVFVPGKKLQSYAYDFATQLLYVGNGGQSVYVIDMRAEEISVVNKISTLLNGPIKSLLYIESNNVLVAFGSQDGAFKVLHCSNFRDPKAKISMFLHFETGLKDTRKAFYWRERKELWTADNFGYVQVLTGVDLHKPLINTSLAIAAPQGTSGSDTPTPKPKRTTAEIRIPVGTRCRIV